MNFEEGLQAILEILKASNSYRVLSQAELLILKASWENIGYKQAIGDQYSYGYISGPVATNLWAYLSDAFGRKVKKNTLRSFIESQSTTSEQEKVGVTSFRGISATVGSERPPNVPNFYGRENDLRDLGNALEQNRCVALIGAAGIGKSALASIYVRNVTSKPQSDFQWAIWMSLHHGQSVGELLESRFKDDDFETLLQDRHSLLVIDCGSADLEEDQDFQALVHKFCVEIYKSSLLILSRDIVTTVKQLASTQRPATTIKLKGLADQDALSILQDQGIQEESDCYRLIESYRGNPQLLLLASERINRFCGGKLESFMLHKTSFASDYVRRVIREYGMNNLTPTEQKVIDVLIQSDQDTPRWIAFSELMTELSSGRGNASMSELIEILESWEGMSLIESDNNPDTGEATFNLPPATRKVLMRSNLNAFASQSQPA